jgi:hypothetical protein
MEVFDIAPEKFLAFFLRLKIVVDESTGVFFKLLNGLEFVDDH